MSPLEIASIVFVCVFSSALLGFFLRATLPDYHLDEDSMRAVTLSTGLIATMSALVLGLLISSAKSSFDRVNDAVTQTAAEIVLLDRALANYGPETKEARDFLHGNMVAMIELIDSVEGAAIEKIDTSERQAASERFQARLRELAPRSDAQRLLQSRALEISNDLVQMRGLLIAQGTGSIPTLFLVVLVFWLAIIFAGFGLATANNATVVAVLFACALSVSGAVFLIEEMDRPIDGLIKVSSAPLRNALAHLGK